VLTEAERRFVLSRPSAHLATADANAVPHVVPVCFALAADSAYVVIDQKPKRVPPERLKRARNILENPKASLLVDHYENDWQRLGWVALHGRAELVSDAGEHREALRLLQERYPQYREMALDEAPVIALRIERVNAWGEMGS
jgi:PPOX class probable F420-dependent enzyme